MADSNRLTPPPLTLSTVAFWSFALSVALLPIVLGGNRHMPLGLAQIGFAISASCLYLDRDLWKEIVFFERLRWALGLLACILVWACLQTQGFMPAQWMHPIWQETAAALHQPVAGAIAISPEDSRDSLSRLITYIACGLLAYVLGQDPKRAKSLVKILWFSVAGICAYGLGVYLLGNDSILFFKKWAYTKDLTATFVNRNHFAIYAAMGFIAGVALLIQSWRDHIGKHKHREPLKAISAWLVKRGLPQAFLLGLVLLCIFLSHSRAGLVLTGLGFGAYLFFYQLYIKAWRRAVVVVVFAILALVLLGITASYYSSRFSVLFSDYSSHDRLTVYSMMWKALLANPWLGYGLGGFPSIFRLYQQGMIMEFNRGHNDVLESLLDLGVPAGLMLWTAIILMLSGLLHGILTRRRFGMFPLLALSVSLTLLAHAMVDFSLQIPGIVLFWTALLGTGLAQSWRETEKSAAIDRRNARPVKA